MKKKIFITGAVRDYDSAAPHKLADEIKDYICQNLVTPECRNTINVLVDEPTADQVRIRFPFTTGDTFDNHTISRELYRCFTGEYHDFHAKESLWWGFSSGPSFPMNVRVDIGQIKEAHKKNTRYYKADRYKSLDLWESAKGLEVLIQY